jgi:hypothetical protein
VTQKPINDVETGALGANLIRRLPLTWWWITTAAAAAIILAASTLYLLLHLGEPIALLILGISIASALSPAGRKVG